MEQKYFRVVKNYPNGRKDILMCSFGPTDDNGVFEEITKWNVIEAVKKSGITYIFQQFLDEKEYDKLK
ncbi:MAG TPA: hypothetical protein PKH79_00045 [Prolixibacteraceae bacterium]|nr:hypothetical protein [Prolixibacteraceae bacterium]HPS11927.1 hypothetical protein [Prolixibacteraceae bacterium]